jgi:hypothetical protein
MRAISEFTNWRVVTISTFQLNDKSISADPRLVIERTSSRPGTLFTAFSSGRVMVTSICSIGITPLSTPTMMRGKLVAGNTAIGSESAS